MANCGGKIFVYGGRGALGATCVSYFKNQNWWVGSIDMKANDEADVNILVKPEQSWIDQETSVLEEVKRILNDNLLDAVICVAGGWAGGNACSKDFIKNSELMWKQSVWSSTIASSVAAKYLKEGTSSRVIHLLAENSGRKQINVDINNFQGGLLTLPGANPALNATPGMIGYGMAKAAVHQLTKSLGSKDGGLPSGSVALALLPITLDTPMNRKWMPNADTSKWTPLDFVAELLFKWSQGIDRPQNGSLVTLVTKDHGTELVFA